MAAPRQDPKLKREMDAARMRGDLPPEQDSSGNLINPHIPEFMAKAPWYMGQAQAAAAAATASAPTAAGTGGGGLAHQKKLPGAPGASVADQSIEALESYYRQRGTTTAAPRAAAFRKGACRNCGSGTHSERECVDRPRKVGAWKTGRDIAPDEVLASSLALGYDAKRDRYAGYNPDEHAATVARFEAAEEERRVVREREKAEAATAKEQRRRAREAAKEARRAARKEEKKAAKKAARDAARAAAASADAGAGADGAARPVVKGPARPPPKAVDEDAETASEAEDDDDDDDDSSGSATDSSSELSSGSSGGSGDEDKNRGDGGGGGGAGKKGSDAKVRGERTI